MNLLAADLPDALAGPVPGLPADELALGQLGLALAFATLGFAFLLPRPRGRAVAVGVFLSLAAAAMAGVFLATTFARPTDGHLQDYVGPALFWLFSGGAVVAGAALVTQSNPARGAMAFAFVVLSTCGLFLLLAAPFLMAATVIIYMGAIIVTFLFVLMLSNARGPSSENDRSREPFLGSLAGFAFTGLVLFTLYLGSPADSPTKFRSGRAESFGLPVAAVQADDKRQLLDAARDFAAAADPETPPADVDRHARDGRLHLAAVVGIADGEAVDLAPGGRRPGTLQDRLAVAKTDLRTARLIEQADNLKVAKKTALDAYESAALAPKPDLAAARQNFRKLHDDALVLAGRGDLPARNVSALGLVLYSEHLIAVEIAGTLLLVATIGAVAIAGRRGAAS